MTRSWRSSRRTEINRRQSPSGRSGSSRCRRLRKKRRKRRPACRTKENSMIIQRRYRCAILLYCGLLAAGGATAQKSVSELTLVYDYSTAGPTGDSAQGAIHTVYIKGNKSRSEMTSSYFSSTTIFDGNTGFGVILREVNEIGRASCRE